MFGGLNALYGKIDKHSLTSSIFLNNPDDILDLILMCLPLKDEVRTTILSMKWINHRVELHNKRLMNHFRKRGFT